MEYTIIIAKSYQHGMTWLRQNAKKYQLDPQLCRITNKAETLKGFKDYTLIWLRGWNACTGAQAIRYWLKSNLPVSRQLVEYRWRQMR